MSEENFEDSNIVEDEEAKKLISGSSVIISFDNTAEETPSWAPIGFVDLSESGLTSESKTWEHLMERYKTSSASVSWGASTVTVGGGSFMPAKKTFESSLEEDVIRKSLDLLVKTASTNVLELLAQQLVDELVETQKKIDAVSEQLQILENDLQSGSDQWLNLVDEVEELVLTKRITNELLLKVRKNIEDIEDIELGK